MNELKEHFMVLEGKVDKASVNAVISQHPKRIYEYFSVEVEREIEVLFFGVDAGIEVTLVVLLTNYPLLYLNTIFQPLGTSSFAGMGVVLSVSSEILKAKGVNLYSLRVERDEYDEYELNDDDDQDDRENVGYEYQGDFPVPNGVVISYQSTEKSIISFLSSIGVCMDSPFFERTKDGFVVHDACFSFKDGLCGSFFVEGVEFALNEANLYGFMMKSKIINYTFLYAGG